VANVIASTSGPIFQKTIKYYNVCPRVHNNIIKLWL